MRTARGTTELIVHRASRVESLLDPLVARLRDDPPPDPFTPITIVVQSRGMQRWLSHQLADRLDEHGRGIAANLHFPFPGAIIDRVVAACGGGADGDPWSADRLVWSILNELDHGFEQLGLERLATYLRVDPEDFGTARQHLVDRRTWALARGIADVFDRYALYRPRLAQAWSRGQHIGQDGGPLAERDRWQPRLWAGLVARLGDPTQRLQSVVDRLRDPEAPVALTELPQPLLSFGISGLPPRHLDVLAALATRTTVELYVPTVSTARWEVIGGAVRAGSTRPDPAHPLLISCGRLLDDAAELLLAHSPRLPGEYVQPSLYDLRATTGGDSATLLEVLQDGLRADRAPDPGTCHHLEVVDGHTTDRSVQIHACHGPARQAEVLRDVILGALADDATLEPRDVLVMTPDIDTFAPLVQAAFVGSRGIPDLPVTVADRHVGRTNPVADALLAMLELATGRVGASSMLDVLGREPVMQRFGLTSGDLDRVTGWVADSGIRWGIDADHRARSGQPPDLVHTWRFGLDRLLLGAVMADEDDRTVGDVTPFDDIEGDDVELVGRVAEACEHLFAFVEGCLEPRELGGWVDMLTEGVDGCLATAPGEHWRVQEVRARLEGLREHDEVPESDADLDARRSLLLDLGAIRTVVERSLQKPRGAAGYETGSVTLCALVPMRSIPHRVVCLVGMDDQAFPRNEARLGFDLLERDTYVGDRDRRAEDRSLFLEAILAARESLLITTTGHDVRTGEDRPPAVPLAELLDVLDRAATTGDAQLSVRDAVTREHPLQAFSPRNFGDRGDGTAIEATSFDAVARDAADAARVVRRRPTPFLDGPLPTPPPDPDGADSAGDPTVVDLEDLTQALMHPTRFLLERRLGLHLREFVTQADDHEPVDLHPLRRAQLGGELLDQAPVTDAWLHARLASATVPAGTPGHVRLAEVADDVARLRERAASRLADVPFANVGDGQRLRIEVDLADRRLVGIVDGLYPIGGADRPEPPGRARGDVRTAIPGARAIRLVARYVRPRPEHLLRGWLAHLALTAAGMTDLRSWIVTRGKQGDDPPSELHLTTLHSDAAEARQRATTLLVDLLEVHALARAGTVPLFPAASPAYTKKQRMIDAHRAFEPHAYGFNAGDRDEYVQLVYGDQASLDDVLVDQAVRDDFARLAMMVWGTAMEHAAASEAAVADVPDGVGP